MTQRLSANSNDIRNYFGVNGDRRKGLNSDAVQEKPIEARHLEDTKTTTLNNKKRKGDQLDQSSSRYSRDKKKDKICPFYKRIKNTKFAVDSFDTKPDTQITHYFLSHFHADHYGGLSSKWNHGTLWCTPVTRNLVIMQFPGVKDKIRTIRMNSTCIISGVEVTALDANHCPGSCMFLFKSLRTGEVSLHTGDFRASEAVYASMRELRQLRGGGVTTLHLDTTYCNPTYVFPSQEKVLTWVAETVVSFVKRYPKSLICCGAYFIGKERIALALSHALGVKIYVDKRRFKTMKQLEWQELEEQLTDEPTETPLHVVNMGSLRENIVTKYCKDNVSNSKKIDVILAIRPTGWTHNAKQTLADIHPTIGRSGKYAFLGVPYSEHSSFVELQRFVRWLKPLHVLPHVNVGNVESRERQNRLIKPWTQ